MADSGLDLEKLARLQARTKAGAKGAPRKKTVAKPKGSGQVDQKVATALKKLQTQALPATEEINMFLDNGNVLHFSAPKVHTAASSNTFAIYGQGQEKELTELVPGILNQLGPESLANLRKLAESYHSMQAGAGPGQQGPADTAEADDDDVPDLVESFEVDENKKDESKSTLDDVN